MQGTEDLRGIVQSSGVKASVPYKWLMSLDTSTNQLCFRRSYS